ncbi:MAG: SCO family protein [Burkholderiales bacterium]
MGVLIRAGWEALRRRMSHAASCASARRIALAQPGVAAVDVARDDESPGLRIAVHLRVAAGFDAGEVAARTQEAIYRRLPIQEVVVRGVGSHSREPRTSRTLWFAVGAAALVLGAFAGYAVWRTSAQPPKFNAVDVTGVPWGRELRLSDHSGQPRALSDFRGKVVMLFFGFTHCPDVCPTALATLAQARRLLGEDARRVQGLFVTVDPKRDTPQVLAKYVTAFDPSFLGLYGDEAEVARAAAEFKIFYHAHAPDAHGAYGVDHSGQVYVIDARGRLRLHIRSHDAAPESIAHDLRLLLDEASA